VIGIRLKGDDEVVGMAMSDPEDALLTVFARGFAKRTSFAEYPPHNRGGQGVRNVTSAGLERNGPVVAARAVRDGDEIILITEGGQSIRMQVEEEQFRTMGRSTGGVKAINVPDKDRLISMAWVRPEDDAVESDAEATDSDASAPHASEAAAAQADAGDGDGETTEPTDHAPEDDEA